MAVVSITGFFIFDKGAIRIICVLITYQEYTEYDKLSTNSIVTNNISAEFDMTNTSIHTEKEFENSQIKVILKFPESSPNDTQIVQEISDILKNSLQEQLNSISLYNAGISSLLRRKV